MQVKTLQRCREKEKYFPEFPFAFNGTCYLLMFGLSCAWLSGSPMPRLASQERFVLANNYGATLVSSTV